MHDDDGRWVVDWVGQMWKCKRGEIESRLTDWILTSVLDRQLLCRSDTVRKVLKWNIGIWAKRA
jgi:hypothetical protein